MCNKKKAAVAAFSVLQVIVLLTLLNVFAVASRPPHALLRPALTFLLHHILPDAVPTYGTLPRVDPPAASSDRLMTSGSLLRPVDFILSPAYRFGMPILPIERKYPK